MSRYDRVYGTDWQTLEKDEAIERAYALGVAVTFGEYDREELEALRNEMDSAYDRSVLDLAFDEGKKEGQAVSNRVGSEGEIWAELVEGEQGFLDDAVPSGGRDGLPEAIDKAELLERFDADSRDALDLPEFLERD